VSQPDAERPRGSRFFDRFTEPLADMARERITHVEDKVRTSIQAEINTVSRSVRARVVQVRPSAIAFLVAALLTVFGLGLFVTAAVLGLSHVVEPWLAAILVGVALLLLATGFAAWGRHRLEASVIPASPAPVDEDELVHPWAD
jgi:hypothetical protein